MRKIISGFTVLGFLILSVSVFAGDFVDLKKKITDVRDTAITMLKNKDQRGADNQKAARDAAEKANDSILKVNAPVGKEVQFTELKNTWAAFKKTREEEVIPLILKGKDEDAKKIVDGVQKERFKKLNDLCDELGE